MTTIAFIGLGNMGAPMALNLLKAGFALRVFDLAAEPLLRLAEAGASVASSPADAVANAEVVITMLPTSKHVRSLYLGDGGVLASAKAGALLIDCSTIAADAARDVAAAAAERGYTMIDAPVSGGTGGATAGTLTFIVGGTADALERARPALSAMGRNIFHAGGSGAGQVAKICNNMLLGVQMIGTIDRGDQPRWRQRRRREGAARDHGERLGPQLVAGGLQPLARRDGNRTGFARLCRRFRQ